MNSRGITFSLPAKIASISFVLTLIGLIGVAFIAYNYSDNVLQKKSLDSLSQKTTREGIAITQAIQTIQDDARFLVESAPVHGISRALENDGFDEQENMTFQMWKERLQGQFATILKQRDFYYQLRLVGIADYGREMIRVARFGDTVEAVPKRELQQKGRRNYFRKGIMLAAGEIFMSTI